MLSGCAAGSRKGILDLRQVLEGRCCIKSTQGEIEEGITALTALMMNYHRGTGFSLLMYISHNHTF